MFVRLAMHCFKYIYMLNHIVFQRWSDHLGVWVLLIAFFNHFIKVRRGLGGQLKDGRPYLFHSFRNKYFNKISLGNMLYFQNKL